MSNVNLLPNNPDNEAADQASTATDENLTENKSAR